METPGKGKEYSRRCCVPNCFCTSKKDKGLSWHVFPVDSILRDEWCKRINKRGRSAFELWKPTKGSLICGRHFNLSGKKSASDILPTYFLDKSYTTSDNIKGIFFICMLLYQHCYLFMNFKKIESTHISKN